ncbi:MAG: DNA gyrase inhibitor YacG, partial [Deltaproteobacteria bacterium]|nr:DNA gyrase inhibitor YacG [Deltaproteobacteria bacterium]
RCKLIDLGKWASEQYRIAGEPVKKEKEPDEEN